jgi:hypothetical protein
VSRRLELGAFSVGEGGRRQTGIAEDPKGGGHLHQERRADDERRQHEAEGDPVRDLLEPGDQLALVDGVHTEPQAVGGEEIEYLVDPLRKLAHELPGLEERGEDVSRRDALPHPLLEQRGGIPADRGVRVKAGIQSATDLVEVRPGPQIQTKCKCKWGQS